MRLTFCIFLFVALFIGSCTTPIERRHEDLRVYLPPAIQDSTQITDDIIRRAVYSDYKVPEGFSKEDYDGGSPYYENTISIHRYDESNPKWFELSTNSLSQAHAWSESSSVRSAYYRTLQSQRETDKFFEFRRVWLEHPTDILLSRVHKASYLDRSMYDRITNSDTLGVFVVRPVDTSNVRDLIEYLWYREHYNLGGETVLCVYVTDLGGVVQFVMFDTHMTRGDWGMCDDISLTRTIFNVSKQSGAITQSIQLVKSLTGNCQ